MLNAKIAPNRRMVNINAHLEDMDRAGIDMEVLSLSMPHVYFDDLNIAVELAKITNDEIAEICAQHPKPVQRVCHVVPDLSGCVRRKPSPQLHCAAPGRRVTLCLGPY